MNVLINKRRGYKPLLYLSDKIILACFNYIYVADLRLDNIKFVCVVSHLSGFKSYLARIPLLRRLLRLEAGPAVALDENDCFLVFFGKNVYHVSLEKKSAKKEVVPAFFNKPLQVLRIQSGVQKGTVLFGDYKRNSEFAPVNIYRRNRNGEWDVAFIFPKGEINHVHGIYEDLQIDRLYILTGDFAQGACIWLADKSLEVVRPFLRVGQMSRACWILPRNGYLIFATDQQADLNYLCTIKNETDVHVNRLFPIAGSSIYFSCSHSDRVIFSTAVEPDSTNAFTLSSMLSTRRSEGMLSDRACVYAGTLEEGFEIIFSGKKDSLPFGLFQFGNIYFPSGTSSDQSYVHFYCSALKGHDGVTYAMKLTQRK